MATSAGNGGKSKALLGGGDPIDGGQRQSRRAILLSAKDDALQMPNRPLKRGENLLDIWDKSYSRLEKPQSKPVTGKRKRTPGQQQDLAVAIAPQKLSQWVAQISQADSFCDYLESRFVYFEELNQIGKRQLRGSGQTILAFLEPKHRRLIG